MSLEPAYPKAPPFARSTLMVLVRSWRNWLAGIDVSCYRIGSRRASLNGSKYLLANDLSLVRKILVDDVKDFPKHPYVSWILKPLVGNSIFSANGEEWARQRRLIEIAFQASELNRREREMMEATNDMIERLVRMQPGKDGCIEIDIEAVMTAVTADVISRTILSKPLAEKETRKIFQAFKRYQKYSRFAYALRLLMPFLTIATQPMRKDARYIRTWIRKEINQRLRDETSDNQNRSNKNHDLLDCLREAVDPVTGTRFGKEELLDQVCFLFLAGHETSASSLTSTAWLLAQDHEAQDRFRLESVSHDNNFSTKQILQAMQFGAAVFKEALRLYPPVSYFNRICIREEKVLPVTPNKYDSIQEFLRPRQALDRQEQSTIRCPFRSLVIVSPWIIQRHEKHWSKPNEFSPERFMRSSRRPQDDHETKDAWLPFGQGPRTCPGAGFALQENLIVMARLVKAFRLETVKTKIPIWTASLTLRTENGVHLRLYPLKQVH